MKFEQIKLGALNIVPLAIGAAAYGFAFGVLAAQLGFPWWGVALMSSFVHAGSSQIVAIERFAADGFLAGAVLAGLALNLRYLGIIASLAPVFKHISLAKRLLAIHLTGDENWALTMAKRAKDPDIGHEFLLGSGLVMIVTWVSSTTLGALVGQSIPDLADYGLGFAFTAAFIAMARAMWRSKTDILPWVITFAVTVLLIKLGAANALAILTGSAAGVIAYAFIPAPKKAKNHDN